ncbi:hypothetical protein BC939DRAFT_287441 [Gamsiella multidivaricata]|uniref:uncharacterized protein n=1 Tax=Gamsiella multidivaricata TaxID=101098 RepID=UPI002220C97A|nr:uncharacterized protein BC939DRAFT_287441 [Gamsiella multidivaricata]KAI7818738.1 hypothetical protein BC939DRAFT_287441 [Gamsiella multidivaricata]
MCTTVAKKNPKDRFDDENSGGQELGVSSHKGGKGGEHGIFFFLNDDKSGRQSGCGAPCNTGHLEMTMAFEGVLGYIQGEGARRCLECVQKGGNCGPLSFHLFHPPPPFHLLVRVTAAKYTHRHTTRAPNIDANSRSYFFLVPTVQPVDVCVQLVKAYVCLHTGLRVTRIYG